MGKINLTGKSAEEIIQRLFDETRGKKYLFRGESRNYTDKVSSTLYREQQRIFNKMRSLSLQEAEEEIIDEAKRFFPQGTSNVAILGKLQHYGGATSLIDFSRDISVALFFACKYDDDQDGYLFLLREDSLKAKEELYTKDYNTKDILLLDPPLLNNNRSLFQSSVFIHSPQGILDKSLYEDIRIPKEQKESLLALLRENFNISEKTIFNDLQGFIRSKKIPNSVDTLFAEGISLFRKGNHEKALANFNRVIQLAPEHKEVYLHRGTALMLSGKFEEALADFDKVIIELDPNNKEAYLNRGKVFGMLRKHQEELASYDKIIELDPNDKMAYLNRGVALYFLGKYTEAVASWNKAIELEPKYKDAYMNRGMTLEKLKKYEEALADYDRVIELDPKYKDAYMCKGKILVDLKRYEEGVEAYSKVIKLYRVYRNAYVNRADAYIKLKDYTKALSDSNSALRLDPQCKIAYLNRGEALEGLGKYTEALTDYEKALTLDPHFPLALELKTRLEQKLKDSNKPN